MDTKSTLVLTFTCPRDALKAEYFGRLSFPGVRRIWCVEPKHAGMPVPDGVERLVLDFDRGESLRGAAAIDGMATVFRELSAEADILIKLDSDTLVLRPEAFTAPIEYSDADVVYIRRHFIEGRLLMNGNCYALSQRAVARAGMIDAAEAAKQYDGHEDKIFSSWLLKTNVDLTSCQLPKDKCHWSLAPLCEKGVIAAHYGYCSFDQAKAQAEAILKVNGKPTPIPSGYEETFKAWRASNAD